MKAATRIIPISVGAVVVLIVVVALLLTLTGAPAVAVDPANTLTSVPAATAPTLDGIADETAWASAPNLAIPVFGGWYGNGTVNVKSVYKNGMVYFLYQYADEDMSTRRGPYQKQADGTWKKIKYTQYAAPGLSECLTPGTCSKWTDKDPAAAYEDKFAVLWNINTPGFAQQGCAVTCHWTDDRNNGKYGRKYTPNAGEKVDMWHFKSVRTGAVFSGDLTPGASNFGQTDDQYIDSTNYCPEGASCAEYGGTLVGGNKDWGRKGDPRLASGDLYADNCQQVPDTVWGGTKCASPAVMPADGDGWSKMNPVPDQTTASYPFIYRNTEVNFSNGEFVAGDELPAIRIRATTGDRAGLPTGSRYADGVWTMEIARPFVNPGNDGVTPSANDVQFTDLDAAYLFGVAVFDNAQVEHSVSSLYQLVFDTTSAKPLLSLSKTKVYWASYADYTNRTLSVDYKISNDGANGAFGGEIVGTVNSGNVTSTNTPLAVGDIAAGSSAAATVKYSVPVGVASFKSTVYLTVNDVGGNSWAYPGPYPGS